MADIAQKRLEILPIDIKPFPEKKSLQLSHIPCFNGEPPVTVLWHDEWILPKMLQCDLRDHRLPVERKETSFLLFSDTILKAHELGMANRMEPSVLQVVMDFLGVPSPTWQKSQEVIEYMDSRLGFHGLDFQVVCQAPGIHSIDI